MRLQSVAGSRLFRVCNNAIDCGPFEKGDRVQYILDDYTNLPMIVVKVCGNCRASNNELCYDIKSSRVKSQSQSKIKGKQEQTRDAGGIGMGSTKDMPLQPVSDMLDYDYNVSIRR
jgi:hypothetical protein